MKPSSVFGRAIIGCSVGLAAAIASIGAVQAQDKTVLRVADVYPVKHPVPNSTIKPFMEEVEKRTNGAISFEYYPSQQLGKGKDLLSLTQSGVVDVGLVVPSYVSDKMPLSGVSELPGSYASSCEGTEALWNLMQGDGVLAKKEFDTNGVQVLIVHAFAPFQAWSSKSIAKPEDYAGQKFRSLGAVMDLTIKKLGGTPVRISAPEIFESLSRGTIDGGMLGVPTVLSYDLVKHVKQGTQGLNFGGAVVTYTVSKDKWNSFSPEVRKVMLEAGRNATLNGCKVADEQVGPGYEKAKAAGVQIVSYDAAAKSKLNGMLAEVANEWAAQLDQRNKPGTEVVQAFRKQLGR